MKRIDDKWVRFERSDLIRLNRLIRGGINLDGYIHWFEELDLLERIALIDTLIAYACETHLDRATYDEAIALAPRDDEWFSRLTALMWPEKTESDPRCKGLIDVRAKIAEMSSTELRRTLPWAVYIFGVSEGRVYANETPESCNHWWHRDLTDERVVNDILSNPNFVYTSMKDDQKFKRSWWQKLFG